MTRAKDLENAVADYLNLTRQLYVRRSTVRCPHCRQYFKGELEGADFIVYHPSPAIIEVKSGQRPRLKPSQRKLRDKVDGKVPYLVVTSVDDLIQK